MPDPRSSDRLQSRWDSAHAATLEEPQRLLYRSNLLGADKRITNFGGGNTSAKITQTDPLSGDPVTVLWVKGSGGDVGTMTIDGFATLYQDKLESLKALYRGDDFEDEMVGYLPHCTFNLNARAASIDTPLHAYVPHAHVDHMHPDALIAIAAAENGQTLTRRIYGPDIGWLPWKRPGYELGLWLHKYCIDHPQSRGVVLGSHGLFTWADSAEACYDTTLEIINKAIDWFAAHSTDTPVFGGQRVPLMPADQRRAIATQLMPVIRGLVGQAQPKVGHFDDSDTVLEFVCSEQMHTLAALGTSCPDHFLRTKIRPFVVPFDSRTPDIDGTCAALPDAIQAYRQDYAAYYERCRHDNSPAMRDPNAVVYLVPGVGQFCFARDKATARVSAEFYTNAINVMREASRVSRYQGLPEQEAFDIEYWLLEEAKLQRMPPPRALAGKVALVTGGAGGIGAATAERLLADGACVVLADIDEPALQQTVEQLTSRHSGDVVRQCLMDVTSEASVQAAFDTAAAEFGGIDILVSNAGIASAANIEDTSLALWNRNMDILATGYFLASRAAFRLMKAQNTGGAIVFIASKNGLAASPGASAYCSAKATEIHLARCLALEGAGADIRVNVINPDAVLRGSKIWSGEWLQQRAEAYGKNTDELEEHYRQRSLLKRSVFPEDIAEAVAFMVSDRSAKSTGNILNVDAGNVQAFTR